MADVEVLAIEVKQFEGEGRRAVVPRVSGLTEKTREEKGEGETKRPPFTREGFLAKCTPEAAQFFTKVLDLAESKQYSVYWGTLSFSIRVRIANENRSASFVYCWPPNLFEIYLARLPLSESDSLDLRKKVMASGIFQEGGKWTLRATLEGETLNQISEAYNLILDKVAEIVKRAKA